MKQKLWTDNGGAGRGSLALAFQGHCDCVFLDFSYVRDKWGWCTGTAQRDGMGREEGGGFGMGNTCIPVADSF